MRKNYVTPSILLFPLQVEPNTRVNGEDNGGMKPIDARDGAYDEDIDMNAGWFDWWHQCCMYVLKQ